MSGVSQEEFDALKERVEELEDQLRSGRQSDDTRGLDHRDETVLEKMKEVGGVGPRETVQYYLHYTDISKRRTAKERAKNLRSHPEFDEVKA